VTPEVPSNPTTLRFCEGEGSQLSGRRWQGYAAELLAPGRQSPGPQAHARSRALPGLVETRTRASRFYSIRRAAFGSRSRGLRPCLATTCLPERDGRALLTTEQRNCEPQPAVPRRSSSSSRCLPRTAASGKGSLHAGRCRTSQLSGRRLGPGSVAEGTQLLQEVTCSTAAWRPPGWTRFLLLVGYVTARTTSK